MQTVSEFILATFVNRLDVYGVYTAPKKGRKANSITSKTPLTLAVIDRHLQGNRIIGCHAISQDNTCKWGCFDLDANSEAKEKYIAGEETFLKVEKKNLLQDVSRLVEVIKKIGLIPVIEDSVGGYHIWLFCNKPVPSEKMYAFLQSILKATAISCEIFPKQASLDKNTPYGNWVRLPGRYHSSADNSKIWDEKKQAFVTLNELGWPIIEASLNNADAINKIDIPATPSMTPQANEKSSLAPDQTIRVGETKGRGHYNQVQQDALSKWIDERLGKIDLLEVLAKYKGLDRSTVKDRGDGHFSFCCPFHGDKSPSGYIKNNDNGIPMVHCSTCLNGNAMTALGVVMQSVSFKQACEELFGYLPAFCRDCGQEIKWEGKKPLDANGKDHRQHCSAKTTEKRKEQLNKARQEQEDAAAAAPQCTIQKEIADGNGNWFLITEQGIYYKYEVKNDLLQQSFFKHELICADAVMITDRYTDISSNACFVKLAWGKREEVVSQDTLLTKNFDRLARLGLRILTENSRGMAKYFLASLLQLDATKDYASRNGWHKHEFILGNLVISPAGERAIEKKDPLDDDDRPKLGPYGEREQWRKTMQEQSADPQVQIVCGASTIAPLLTILNIEPFVVHLFQESSCGKTLLAKMAASLWGNYTRIVKAWNGTKSMAGHENYFHNMKNLPCFLDETQLATPPEIVPTTVYLFCMKTGKTRATVTDGEVTEARKKDWNTVLLSTGEKKISTASNYAGVSARLIEIYRRKYKEMSKSEIRQLLKTLENNYGFGSEVIRYIQQPRNLQAIEQLFNETLDKLEANLNDQDAVIKRTLEYWAAILVGCRLNQILFGFHCDEKAIWVEMYRAVCAVEKKGHASFLEWLLDVVAANPDHFGDKTKGGITQRNDVECWGLVESDGADKKLYFFPDKLKTTMTKSGWDWSEITILKENGYLEVTKGRYNLKAVKIKQFTHYLVCVKVAQNTAAGCTSTTVVQPASTTVEV